MSCRQDLTIRVSHIDTRCLVLVSHHVHVDPQVSHRRRGNAAGNTTIADTVHPQRSKTIRLGISRRRLHIEHGRRRKRSTKTFGIFALDHCLVRVRTNRQMYPPSSPLPNVRAQKKKIGRTDIQANSAGVRRTSRKFVLINSAVARQQRTFRVINLEASGHSE